MVIAPQGLRGGVDGDWPAVGRALPVDPPPEVPDEQVAAHLQARHGALEVLLAALAKSGPLLQFIGEPLVPREKLVHDPFLAHGGQFLVPAAVEVVAVPPPVGEVGKPLPGDEAGLFAEELAIGHLSAPGDEAAPLPGVLRLVPGPPVEVGGVLLCGEAVHLVFEQGQEAQFVDQADEFLPRLDPAGVVPVQPPHDPLPVFDGHGTASLYLSELIIAYRRPRFHSGHGLPGKIFMAYRAKPPEWSGGFALYVFLWYLYDLLPEQDVFLSNDAVAVEVSEEPACVLQPPVHHLQKITEGVRLITTVHGQGDMGRRAVGDDIVCFPFGPLQRLQSGEVVVAVADAQPVKVPCPGGELVSPTLP